MGPRHAKSTTKLARGLKPQSSQYEVTDTELPGFRVRVMPSGVKSFSVVYQTRRTMENGAGTLSAAMAS